VDHVENSNALDVEVGRFADVMSLSPIDRPVPSCPGWDVRDLAEHLGVIHRWAEELVRRRSSVRIPRGVSDDVRAAVSPEWIRDGGQRLVATLLGADPDDEMWAWGLDQHVRFWSRRQLHETLVHRMDLELAAQIEPRADPVIVIDAIDEYLSNIEKVAQHSSDLSHLRGNGERLVLRVRGAETLWVITLDEGGFRLSKDEGAFTTELVGTPLELLLVILGRRAVDQSGLEVLGERRLLDFWLSHSAFD
jgi:uncharacterized protein (TIGR03083 family)